MRAADNDRVLFLKGFTMAIGWISLLKTVPWVDVIKSAPAVAEGAKKLWRTVAQKPGAGATPASRTPVPRIETLAQAQARLMALESTVAELHTQMLASSELIQALADQNTALVKRVEVHRKRLLWLSGVVAIALVLALLNWAGVLVG